MYQVANEKLSVANMLRKQSFSGMLRTFLSSSNKTGVPASNHFSFNSPNVLRMMNSMANPTTPVQFGFSGPTPSFTTPPVGAAAQQSSSTSLSSINASPSVSAFQRFNSHSTVLRDSKALAAAMVKYIPDSEIDSYKAMLQTMREHPDIKPLVLKKLSGQIAKDVLSESLSLTHSLANSQVFGEGSAALATASTSSPPSSSGATSSTAGAVSTTPMAAKRQQHSLRNKTQWVDQWLLKALTNKRANLFPLKLPSALSVGTNMNPSSSSSGLFTTFSMNGSSANAQLDPIQQEYEQRLLAQKAKLAAYLFSNKQIIHSSFREFLLTTEPFNPFPEEQQGATNETTVDGASRRGSSSHRVSSYASTSSLFRAVQPNKEEEQIYIEASKIADELGDILHTDRLVSINRLVKQFVEGDISGDQLLIGLSDIASLHMDYCKPLIDFLDIPLVKPIQLLIQSRQIRRNKLTEELHAELSYLVYLHSVANTPTTFRNSLVTGNGLMNNNSNSLSSTSKMDELFDNSGTIVSQSQYSTSIAGGLASSEGFAAASLASSSSGMTQTPQFMISPTPRRLKVGFGTTHTFEVAMRCFSKSTSSKFSVDLNSHLEFQSSIKNTLSSASNSHNSNSSTNSSGSDENTSSSSNSDYDLLIQSMKSVELDDLELLRDSTSTPVINNDENHNDDDIANMFASPQRKILIDNLPNDITENDIRMALRKCGIVQKVFLFKPSNIIPPSQMLLNELVTTPPTDQLFDLPNTSLLESLAIDERKQRLQKHNKKLNGEMDINSDDEDNGKQKKRENSEDDDDDDDDDDDLEGLDVGPPCSTTLAIDKANAALAAGKGDPSTPVKKRGPGGSVKQSKTYKRKLNGLLKGTRTDNYAFVIMADDDGYNKICCDAIRIFGININVSLIALASSH